MTLPVPKAVADASLDAAILVCLARYPGLRRYEIEDDRTVAAILARVSPESKARNWLSDRLGRPNDAGKIERRRGRVGWFPVTQERAAS